MTSVSVTNLSVRLTDVDQAPLTAAVSFDVNAGETVAIVGESGSGKSITGRAIMGLLPPTLAAHGSVMIGDRRTDGDNRTTEPLRGSTVAMLLQDPFTMLHPLRKLGAQLLDGLGRSRQLSRRQRRDLIVARLAEVGLDSSVAELFPHQLSGGMRQRAGIAAALLDDPEVLIADEPTTALDATTQRDIMRLIERLQQDRGLAVVLITHDLALAFATSDQIVVMYAGLVMEHASAEAIGRRPWHPYTAALLDAEPIVTGRLRSLGGIPGNVPAHREIGDACAFAPRCRYAAPECVTTLPALVEHRPGHMTACLRVDELDLTRADREIVPDVGAADPSQDALLSVTDVAKTFPGQNIPALDNVSIAVRRGEAVAIVGESGSGKTTLARIIVGLETADTGTVLIGDVDASSWDDLDRAVRRALRSNVQMVFQDPYTSLDPRRTINQTLREALRAFGQPADDGAIDHLLALVHLASHHGRARPAMLSGGERQRVAIARALAAEPELIIFDEAVSALDVSVQAQILELIHELRSSRDLSVLFITHDLAVARQTTDTTYVLRAGHVVEVGPTPSLLASPEDAYTKRLLDSVPGTNPHWLSGDESVG